MTVVKKMVVLVFLAGASCDAMFPKDHELRGFSDEELKAGPSYHQMKGAILHDVRVWRQLEQHLDEGKPTCRAIVFGGEKKYVCALDQTELVLYYLSSEQEDKPYRVEETAYYCTKESVYYYHYVGGPRNRDVWLGPYRLERKPHRVDD